MSQEEVKNKLKTLTQGSKGDKVIESMARTFRTLCDYADWTEVFPNVIMHSGELSARDIERIGINIRDWISQVGA